MIICIWISAEISAIEYGNGTELLRLWFPITDLADLLRMFLIFEDGTDWIVTIVEIVQNLVKTTRRQLHLHIKNILDKRLNEFSKWWICLDIWFNYR